jgi:hypothetical protein
MMEPLPKPQHLVFWEVAACGNTGPLLFSDGMRAGIDDNVSEVMKASDLAFESVVSRLFCEARFALAGQEAIAGRGNIGSIAQKRLLT